MLTSPQALHDVVHKPHTDSNHDAHHHSNKRLRHHSLRVTWLRDADHKEDEKHAVGQWRGVEHGKAEEYVEAGARHDERCGGREQHPDKHVQ